jgi:hypothetical protein
MASPLAAEFCAEKLLISSSLLDMQAILHYLRFSFLCPYSPPTVFLFMFVPLTTHSISGQMTRVSHSCSNTMTTAHEPQPHMTAGNPVQARHMKGR